MVITWASSPLSQSEAHTVAKNWDDIVQHLAPPTIVWDWSKTGLAPKTRHHLKEDGLIEQTDGGKWRATEELWMDVIDRAAPDETIGADAVGQDTLIAPTAIDNGEGHRESRTLGNSSSPPKIIDQMTLSGDRVETFNEDFDKVGRNWSKKDNGSRDAGDDPNPGQLQLVFFEEEQTQLDEWVEAVAVTDTLSA